MVVSPLEFLNAKDTLKLIYMHILFQTFEFYYNIMFSSVVVVVVVQVTTYLIRLKRLSEYQLIKNDKRTRYIQISSHCRRYNMKNNKCITRRITFSKTYFTNTTRVTEKIFFAVRLGTRFLKTLPAQNTFYRCDYALLY